MTRDIAIVFTLMFLAICNMVSSILTARQQDRQDARLVALEAATAKLIRAEAVQS